MALSKLSYRAPSELSDYLRTEMYGPFRLPSLGKARVVLMWIYEACVILMQTDGESEQTVWLSKCQGLFINNCLSSTICVILRSQPFTSFRQCWSSYMMKLQGLIVTAQSSSGDRRPTFGFDVLPFVGVVFFPSSSLVGVVLFPSFAH